MENLVNTAEHELENKSGFKGLAGSLSESFPKKHSGKIKIPIKPKLISSTQNEPHHNAVDDLVHTIENLKQEDALGHLNSLCGRHEKTYFEMGGVLSVISINKWFEPHESFHAFVEQVVGMKYRKAMYLIDIYNTMANAKIDWGMFEHLGWSKMRRLAKVLNPENANEWITFAANHLNAEIDKRVRDHFAASDEKVAPSPKPKNSKILKLHDDQAASVELAIKKAKQESGTSYDSSAIEYICIDYMASKTLVQKLNTLSPEALSSALALVFKKFDSATIDMILNGALAVPSSTIDGNMGITLDLVAN